MKHIALTRIITVSLLLSILSLQTACIVYHGKDNGKHKGWYKGSRHPGNSHSNHGGNKH